MLTYMIIQDDTRVMTVIFSVESWVKAEQLFNNYMKYHVDS